MLTCKSAYWWCQIIGWSGNALATILFAWIFRSTMPSIFFYRLTILFSLGFLLTHIMRWVIIKLNLLQKSFDKQLVYFLSITISFALIYAICSYFLISSFSLQPERNKNYTFIQLILGNAFNAFVWILTWNLIYFIYYYAARFRKQQIDKFKLESLMDELELKSEESEANQQLIFDTLENINTLVDENPPKARTKINELSNILRKSMQIEMIKEHIRRITSKSSHKTQL